MFITWGYGGTVAGAWPGVTPSASAGGAPAAAGAGGTASDCPGGTAGWTGGGLATTVAAAAAAAGTASRVAADWPLKASAVIATSQPAAFCRPPSMSLGAFRPRSAACPAAMTAAVKAAQAIQLRSRTTARKSVPLSLCSNTRPI